MHILYYTGHCVNTLVRTSIAGEECKIHG